MGKFFQPLVQPLAHFSGGFARKGDGQNFMGPNGFAQTAIGLFLERSAIQQRPHDA